MTAQVTSRHEVKVSIMAGNAEIFRDSGKVTLTTSSVESVDHAASKLEAIGLQIVKEAQKLRETYA